MREGRKEDGMSRYGKADYDDFAAELESFLKEHNVSELLELVADAVGDKEWWEGKLDEQEN